MRRDMDLIRTFLIRTEESDGPVRDASLTTWAGSRAKALYHVELMRDCGLVRASVRMVTGPDLATFSIDGLTWEGCDYLDAIRSDSVWRRAKDAVATVIGDAPLSVMKSVCTSLVLKAVQSELGIS